MGDENRWERVRQIVREECERIEQRILSVMEKSIDYKPARTSQIRFANGGWTGITDAHLTAWREAYGSVDVEVELKKAAAWVISNPQEAPRSQFGKFLNAWMGKNQNRSAIRSIPMKSELQKERRCAWCGSISTGMTNGNEHCSIHAIKAMHEDPPRKIA